MRVTTSSMFVTYRDGLTSALSDVQKYQTQLSTGRKINTYADDPAGAVASLRNRSDQAQWQSYSDAAGDAKSWLNDTDSTMQTMSGIVQKINELTIQSANGALSSAALKANADQIRSLRDELYDLANAKHLGRSLFGGFADKAVALVAGVYSFVGDGGQVIRQIGPASQLQANVDGAQVFGFDQGAGNDIFSTVGKLADDVEAGNTTAMGADQTKLQGHLDTVLSTLGIVGARTNRADEANTLSTDTIQTMKTQQSGHEDADLANSVLHLQQAQLAYQSALGAVSRASMPTLADYLK